MSSFLRGTSSLSSLVLRSCTRLLLPAHNATFALDGASKLARGGVCGVLAPAIAALHTTTLPTTHSKNTSAPNIAAQRSLLAIEGSPNVQTVRHRNLPPRFHQPYGDKLYRWEHGKMVIRLNYHRRDGKPRAAPEVIDRFYRLNNGMWIRTRAGRYKKVYKRDPYMFNKYQDHVLCTQRRCWMLDKLVTKFYKMPKYYPDDPYQHYEKLENLSHYNFPKKKYLP